jgi:hypothetical protein
MKVLHLNVIYLQPCIVVDIFFINLYFVTINNKWVYHEKNISTFKSASKWKVLGIRNLATLRCTHVN